MAILIENEKDDLLLEIPTMLLRLDQRGKIRKVVELDHESINFSSQKKMCPFSPRVFELEIQLGGRQENLLKDP